MDFELDETQRVIAASAADVLRAGDETAWRALAKAGLLGLTLPCWLDGDGLGPLEAAVLLTEVGRAAAPVPALATIMLGALPVGRWGSDDLQRRLLPGVAAGDVLLTAAIRERSSGMPPLPATVVTGAGPAMTITGTKIGVAYAAEAAVILVPARVRDSRCVAVVERDAPGVGLARTPTSGGAPEYTLRLTDAPVTELLGAAGSRGGAADELDQFAAAGAAAVGDGLVAGALALTTKHLATREQFGRPLATFQAVAQQVADVYITSRTLHLAALSACWRLAEGLAPAQDAAQDADIAAYWLAAEAPAAMRSCHHLHGGIGMDISYPLHRYAAAVADLTRFVGGADYRLGRLAGLAGQDGTEPACSSI